MDARGKAAHLSWDTQHWWTRSTRWICGLALDLKCRETGGRKLAIWDAGCGSGHIADFATKFGAVTATDRDAEMIERARAKYPMVDFRCASIGAGLDEGLWDVVLSMDVLYHGGIEDWVGTLRLLARSLADGGFLVMQVPAYGWLAGGHDLVVGGVRRFVPRDVRRAILAADLDIRVFSHRFMLLTPFVWLRRVVWRGQSLDSDLEVSGGSSWVGWLLEGALRLESRLILAGWSFEVGSSLFVVAERRGA
jgi:SAM-dependent methyltransferase